MGHKVVSIMVSADWHLGTIPTEQFQKELLTLTNQAIAINRGLDLFVVAGDTFDTKEYFSSEVVKAFFRILVELLELTKDYNTQFRFLEGTRTHDALQLDTLQFIFEDLMHHERIKIIQEVMVEQIFDMQILYIPEEYITDSEAYYKDYFARHYDFLFGHGNTDMMWYMDEQPTSYSSAPVFEMNTLCGVANYAYFGHFHYNQAGGNDNRFKSIGPVTRWEFGKDGVCGVYHIAYDTTTNLAFETYLENTMAQILATVALTIKKDYDLAQLQAKILKKLKSVDYADKVRLIINLVNDIPNYATMRDTILTLFNRYPGVTLILNTIPGKQQDQIEQQKSTEEVVREKPYLYDKSMSDAARIASRIRIKKGVHIPIEYITEVITKPNMQKGQPE